MKYSLSFRFCPLGFLLLLILGLGAPGRAATYTVDRTDDAAASTCSAAANDCTLRGAVTKANTTAGTDTINFDVAIFATSQTITLGTALESLTEVKITGPGANLLTVRTNSGAFAVFTVNFAASVLLSDLTLSNALISITVSGGTLGVADCVLSDNGTGISNQSGTVTATRCTVSRNSSYGMANNGGTLTATNCTLNGSANSASIYNSNNGTLTVAGCTLSGTTNGVGVNTGINNDSGTLTAANCTIIGSNIGIGNGGTSTMTHCTLSGNNYGLYNHNGTTTIRNTLVAGNLHNTLGTITDGGYNITSGTATEAGLVVDGSSYPVLADNGGPTKTVKLLPGSPAIDQGNSFGATTDQRGFNRPVDDPSIAPAFGGDNSDIGAFEFGSLPSLSVNNPRSLPEGSADLPGSTTFEITLNAPSTQSVTVNYQTRDGINNPAIAGSDYVEKHGKLTFAPGETLKRVTIFFIGDNKAETKETFFLDLITPTKAVIADSRGVGTIANDDATPSLFENDEPS